ncbi:hypothetical protein [Candidatus Methylacidithermus pantelleriae]|uniref:hypothetical protein n=1 Tax=Candidatus Methylacidithermus pantelleriae TaxID=2744239 RepID=UPI00157CE814|nr:hypothetical protein [Candidatus Methylacidithermus pantelleriae]
METTPLVESVRDRLLAGDGLGQATLGRSTSLHWLWVVRVCPRAQFLARGGIQQGFPASKGAIVSLRATTRLVVVAHADPLLGRCIGPDGSAGLFFERVSPCLWPGLGLSGVGLRLSLEWTQGEGQPGVLRRQHALVGWWFASWREYW